MKNLIVGAIDLYGWDKVKHWVKSARESTEGTDTDIALLVYRYPENDPLIAECGKHGVSVYQVSVDPFGKPLDHNVNVRGTQSHYMRFFHLWQLLASMPDEYSHVITTDVRDVIFQTNPFVFMQSDDMKEYHALASEEGLLVKHEPWNMNNINGGYGPQLTRHATDNNWRVYNVGVLGGRFKTIKGLCLTIYAMASGKDLADQSSFIVLLNELLNSTGNIQSVGMEYPWAAQCGTTLDPDKKHLLPNLLCNVPVIENGLVCTSTYKEPFAMVHQWDRVPELARAIEIRYQ